MNITVSLFAAHREALGTPSVAMTVPDGTAAGQVWDILTRQHPSLNGLPTPTAVAVNDSIHAADHPLTEGDQVALLAPVSGGEMLELVRDPIRVDALLEAVRHPGAGAVVLFLGIVREHSRGRDVDHLEYEAYEALARSEIARIAAQAVQRWGVRIAIVHRLGALAIGEISVAIAIAAPHRRDAFDAGRFAIDTLKQTVPIWKKEVWADGAEWIGEEDRPVPDPRAGTSSRP